MDTPSPIIFESDPSPNLWCPICQDIFTNPVIVSSCFHTFCKSCLVKSFGREKLCPLCRGKVDPNQLIPNMLIASLVGDLRVKCRNQCEWVGPFSQLNDHETGSCKKRPVVCIHTPVGCKWKGSFQDLPAHISNCPFELFQDYMRQTQEQIDALKSQITQLTLKLQHTSAISSLTNSSDSIIKPAQAPAFNRESVSDSIARLECKYTIQHHTRNVTGIALGDDGKFFFSASHDTDICMWNSETGELMHKFVGNKDSVWALAYMDGMLFSGSDGSLKSWSVPIGPGQDAPTMTRFQASEEGKTYCLVPDRNSDLLFSGHYKSIAMWDKNSKQLVMKLAAHDDCVWSLFLVDNMLLSGSDDGTLKVWDLKKIDTPLKTLEFADSKFLSVTAGGGFIFGGTQNGMIHVWTANTFEHVTALRGHMWDVWQLCYAGGVLFSGSYDHTIKIWDLETMSCMKTLTGHKSAIHALKIEQYGADHSFRVISGSGDKTIKIWESPVAHKNNVD